MTELFGHLSGVMTAVLMLVFIGIAVWAWSGKRRQGFDAAARLPLEEDPAPAVNTANRERQP
jgi:cytochrome c oxidase cbb3-type subunit 4